MSKPTIRIIRALLPIASSPYIETEDGKLSYVAQVCHQLHPGLKTITKDGPVRLISDLKVPIMHFTRMVRNKIVNTDLGSDINNLTPSPESERRLVDLLKNICTVEFE